MIQYKEEKLSNVIAYYVKGFEPPKGEDLFHYEYFLDINKKVIVFKLYLDKNRNDAETRQNE
ncbi:MAG: hypothetical protein AABY22_34055 [Nanoarchaeota archaeon]